MKALRLLISGRVQGVGYRNWLVRLAGELGVRGWVRNLGDAQVEAVICGAADAVDACVAACWRGPPAARVQAVACTPAEIIDAPGFRWLESK